VADSLAVAHPPFIGLATTFLEVEEEYRGLLSI